MVGHDNLCAYRDNQWYYPGDYVQQNELSPSNYNWGWHMPNLTGINDIFYHPATQLQDNGFFEFNNLVISANNQVYAINSKDYYFNTAYLITNYYLTVDGTVSVLGRLGNQPFYAGNFSTIDIGNCLDVNTCWDNTHYDCDPVQEAEKMFSMSMVAFLPIELAEFTVKSNDNKTVQLAWTSLTENNSSHYEIERKADNEDFAYVGTVAAAGESLEEINYTYEDDISKVSGNYAYYRLKMVDKDGSYEYSDVRSLRLEVRDSRIIIAPNPAGDNVELSMPHLRYARTTIMRISMDIRRQFNRKRTHQCESSGSGAISRGSDCSA